MEENEDQPLGIKTVAELEVLIAKMLKSIEVHTGLMKQSEVIIKKAFKKIEKCNREIKILQEKEV
jgi:hypothetical protein